jgi:hypothetical protein
MPTTQLNPCVHGILLGLAAVRVAPVIPLTPGSINQSRWICMGQVVLSNCSSIAYELGRIRMTLQIGVTTWMSLFMATNNKPA